MREWIRDRSTVAAGRAAARDARTALRDASLEAKTTAQGLVGG